MARTNPITFVSFVGMGVASPILAKVITGKNTVLAGATRCKLRSSAFNAETPAEVRARLMPVMVAGHAGSDEGSLKKFWTMMYELTGREEVPEQDDRYQNAREFVRQLLLGKKAKKVSPLYPVEEIQRVIEIKMGMAITAEFTEKQEQDMTQAWLDCMEAQKNRATLEQIAKQPLGGMGGKPPAPGAGPPQQGTQPSPQPAPEMEPAAA
jgi:hypothetical protein